MFHQKATHPKQNKPKALNSPLHPPALKSLPRPKPIHKSRIEYLSNEKADITFRNLKRHHTRVVSSFHVNWDVLDLIPRPKRLQKLNWIKHHKLLRKLSITANPSEDRSIKDLVWNLEGLTSLSTMKLDFSYRESISDADIRRLLLGVKRLAPLYSVSLDFHCSYEIIEDTYPNFLRDFKSIAALSTFHLEFLNQTVNKDLEGLYEHLETIHPFGGLNLIFQPMWECFKQGHSKPIR